MGAAQRHSPKKDNSGNSNMTTALLGVCILLMSAVTFWGLYNNIPRSEPLPQFSGDRTPHQKTQPVQPVQPPPNYATKADVEAAVEKMARQLDKVNERLDKNDKTMATWGQRVWMLVLAHNENVFLRQRQEGTMAGCNNYIVFDQNWKMNRMPSTMQMSDEQRKKLEKLNQAK